MSKYLGTIWNKLKTDKSRGTFINESLGARLLVVGMRGVITGDKGFKKVQVSIANDMATVIAEDPKDYRGGHQVKEWLSGKEDSELNQFEK